MTQASRHEAAQQRERLVGPVIRGMDAELAEAIAAAAETDNQGRDVRLIDSGGYIRIHTPHLFRLTRASLERELGYSCPLSTIETALTSFAGRMTVCDEEITWYLEGKG